MGHRSSALRLTLPAAVLAIAACQDSSQPVAPTVRGEAALSQQASPQGVGLDQAALARSIRGFGGLFLDGGVPTVYLTDPSQRGEVERQLAGFASARGLSSSAIRVRQGAFDYLQLDRWFRAASLNAFALAGTLYTDLDEANNRVLVAVENAAAIGPIKAALATANIPDAALSIQVRKPIIAMATLREDISPMVAGIQINFNQWVCSLGFNAKDGTENSFITASHCTKRQGGVDGTLYYQPLKSVDNTVVATEVEDPVYVKGGDCPKGRKCRYSDASRARYSTGVTFALGSIAKTSGANNGSITITGAFSITGQNTSGTYVVGDVVSKVGRSSGWTQGQITETCVLTGVSGSTIALFCQDFVDAGVVGGDSGSPVFSGGTNNNVTLEGILWGGSSDGTQFVFSSFKNIVRELGSLTVH